MNLTQLKVFSEVMKSGSISKTAKILNRTQPAITLSIKNLEYSLGFKLFERQGRQLVAVPEAYYLLEETEDILNRVSSVKRTMSSIQNAKTGNLKVASMSGPASYLFPRFISKIIGDNTNVEVSLLVHSSVQIHELAATQSIDFGFADLGTKQRETSQYSIEKTIADSFIAIPKDHPLASKKEVSIIDLDNLPMGGLQSNHQITEKIIASFKKENLVYNKTIESQTFLPLLQFVSAGQCIVITDPISVITEMKTNSLKGDVVFRPLKEKIPYEYAVLSSSFRPLSRIALNLKNEWHIELNRLLNEINANPISDSLLDSNAL